MRPSMTTSWYEAWPRMCFTAGAAGSTNSCSAVRVARATGGTCHDSTADGKTYNSPRQRLLLERRGDKTGLTKHGKGNCKRQSTTGNNDVWSAELTSGVGGQGKDAGVRWLCGQSQAGERVHDHVHPQHLRRGRRPARRAEARVEKARRR